VFDLRSVRRAEIAESCRRFEVSRLDVFGSSARRVGIDPDRSDVDLLIHYLPSRRPSLFAALDRPDALTDLLGRRANLVTDDAVENPFIRAGSERFREPIDAARPVGPIEHPVAGDRPDRAPWRRQRRISLISAVSGTREDVRRTIIRMDARKRMLHGLYQ
jgi:predicted nucleotidyltransferase